MLTKDSSNEQNYREYHTDTTAHFQLVMTQHGMKVIETEGLEKGLKLSSLLSTSNMVLFNAHGKLRKYSTPEEILEDFYDVRYTYYQKRKVYTHINICSLPFIVMYIVTYLYNF